MSDNIRKKKKLLDIKAYVMRFFYKRYKKIMIQKLFLTEVGNITIFLVHISDPFKSSYGIVYIFRCRIRIVILFQVKNFNVLLHVTRQDIPFFE